MDVHSLAARAWTAPRGLAIGADYNGTLQVILTGYLAKIGSDARPFFDGLE